MQQIGVVGHRCLYMEATETRSFEDIVAVERLPMLRLAILMLGSAPEAEEVVQEAFIGLSSRWETLDNPGGYLRTSVVNGCRQVLRHRQVVDRYPSPTPSPAWQATTVEMHDALFGLSERQRVAVVLRYFLDWNDHEIAHALDCRPSTVRSLLRRGLAQLRKDLT